MTAHDDPYDTLAHWLAFDVATTRMQRREALRRGMQELRRTFTAIGRAFASAFAPFARTP